MKKGKSKNPTLIRVSTLSEYINVVQALAREEDGPIWLRGQSSAGFKLIPSALRDTIPLTSPLGHQLRGDEIIRASGGLDTGLSPERMLEDFKRLAIPFLEFQPRNDFEWLFLMQHHGAPTRLLDWTTNSLVALYFAISELRKIPGCDDERDLDEFDSSSAAVFVMNPRKINMTLHANVIDPVDIAADFKHWEAYSRPTEIQSKSIDTYGPLCVVAPQISSRIRAQSGHFTLHGSNLDSLDHYNVTRPLFTKILIHVNDAVLIRSQLYGVGITPSFIYPGLDGIAKEVKENEERTFIWERERYFQKNKKILKKKASR